MRYNEIIEGEAEKMARAERYRKHARMHRDDSRESLKMSLDIVGIDVEEIDPTLNDPKV